MSKEYKIIHRPKINKFLIRFKAGKYAYLKYELKNNKMYIISTYTHPDYRGRGFAGKLMLAAIEYAKKNGFKIIPICSYALYFFEKHREYKDVVSES